MRCEPAWRRSENEEEWGMEQQTQHGLIRCFGYRSWDSSSYAFPHPTASLLTRLCKCTLYMHNEPPMLFCGILMLQTLNAAWGKDQSKLFNYPVFSSRTILNATAFLARSEKVTPRNGFSFLSSPSPFLFHFFLGCCYAGEIFSFSWRVRLPLFPAYIPSTTTTAQHVEREGKCVKTLLHPSLPWLFIPSPRGKEEGGGIWPLSHPISVAATAACGCLDWRFTATGGGTAAQGTKQIKERSRSAQAPALSSFLQERENGRLQGRDLCSEKEEMYPLDIDF